MARISGEIHWANEMPEMMKHAKEEREMKQFREQVTEARKRAALPHTRFFMVSVSSTVTDAPHWLPERKR